jgi:hypothetical protein
MIALVDRALENTRQGENVYAILARMIVEEVAAPAPTVSEVTGRANDDKAGWVTVCGGTAHYFAADSVLSLCGFATASGHPRLAHEDKEGPRCSVCALEVVR